jgi:hypothetical protein
MIWLENFSGLARDQERPYARLIEAIRGTRYASTILASIRRRGKWSNLDYYHFLGSGARELAATRVGKAINEFKIHAENILSDDELSEAHDFVQQLVDVLDSMTDSFLQRMQLAGRAAYAEQLESTPTLWRNCDSEWGAGAGFRDRVVCHNQGWFSDEELNDLHEFVEQQITQGWNEITTALRELLENGSSLKS